MPLTNQFFEAAVPTLTYVEADYNKLKSKLVECLLTDAIEKKVNVPEFDKIPFALNAKTKDGQITGSCSGYSVWGELHINMFCVSPDMKVPGTGKLLMQSMEQLARERGCTRMGLDTYSWQARPFYEKMGYRVFGTAKDYPKGHERYFMEKVWPAGSAMDVSPYALVGKAAGAAELAVVKADQGEADVRLDKWLNDETQSRHIEGVPDHINDKFALEVRLPDGSLAVACCYETLWGEMHISFMDCSEDKKDQGIDAVVLRHLFDVARAKGCYRVALETMSWQAQLLYEQHGFTQFGIQKGFPAPDTARVFLEKRL